MVMKPQKAIQWHCEKCHWTDNHIQQSDCLTPHPKQCPKCGGRDFEMKEVSTLDSLLDKVGTLFR